MYRASLSSLDGGHYLRKPCYGINSAMMHNIISIRYSDRGGRDQTRDKDRDHDKDRSRDKERVTTIGTGIVTTTERAAVAHFTCN